MGLWTQLRPPKPPFTERNLGDLSAKVYLITGSNTGVGKQLAQILYSKNAAVYIAARSESKAADAISSIRAAFPSSTGRLEPLRLDLADLADVARAAAEFRGREPRLDVLFNNAGVMHPPRGSLTKQGYEMQLGVNNLGHVLLTEMLTPLLAETAAAEAAAAAAAGEAGGGGGGGVRVVWVSSLFSERGSPPNGFDPDNIDYSKTDKDTFYKYSVSKAGAYYQGAEYATRQRASGIVSVSCNPGNLKSDLQRHYGPILRSIINLSLFPAINGAYTELYSGLSPEVTLDKSGTYIIPWGRLASQRADLEKGARPVSEGGTGMAETWYNWCLEQVRPFMES